VYPILSEVAKILRIAGGRERGPLPSFVEPHLLFALIIVGETRTIGRQALARRIGVGEGAIRTILKRLREDGYLHVNASGCSLSRGGLAAYGELRRVIPAMLKLGSTNLTVGRNQFAILVRGAARRVANGIDQRDAAIKVGAAGATTYLLRNSKFQIPRDSSDCERDFPGPVWGKLRRELRPVEGDAVIVCGAEDELLSVLGALSAATTIIRR